MNRLKDIPQLAPDASNLKVVMAAVREALQTFRGYRGDALDRALTPRDFKTGVLAPLLSSGSGAGSGSTIVVGGGTGNGGGTVEPDRTPPPTPTGLNVTPGISFILVSCDQPTYTVGHGHGRTVVYGAKRAINDPSLPTFNEAVELFSFQGTFSGYPTEPSTHWFIWIKWRSNDGYLSTDPAGGTNGFAVTTGLDVSALLVSMSGQITRSQLYQDIGRPIDSIFSGNVANARMEQGTAGWFSYGTLSTGTGGSSGGTTLRSTGTQLQWGTPIPIDTRRTYKVRCRIRQLIDSSDGNRAVYVGVICYDSNKNSISNSLAGNYPYCAVIGAQLQVSDGWQTYEGTITGTTPIPSASPNYNAFWSGAAYAVPMAIFNYPSGAGTVEIDYFDMIDVTEGQQALAGLAQEIIDRGTAVSTETLQRIAQDGALASRIDVVGAAFPAGALNADPQMTSFAEFWTLFAGTTPARVSGSASDRYAFRTQVAAYYQDRRRIPFDRSKTYAISVRARTSAANSSIDGTLYVYIQAYDAAGSAVTSWGLGGGFSYYPIVNQIPGTNWTNYAQTFSAVAQAFPTTVVSISVGVLSSYTIGAVGSGWMDVEQLRLTDETNTAAIVTVDQARVSDRDAIASRTTTLETRLSGGDLASFAAFKSWDFNGSLEGWTAYPGGYGVVTLGTGRLVINSNPSAPDGETATCILYRPLSASEWIDGSKYSKVRMRVRRSGATRWTGVLFYAISGGHGESADYYKQIPEPSWDSLGFGVAEWDMAVLTAGGADWGLSTISLLRFDLSRSTGLATGFEVDWIAVGSRTSAASSAALQIEASTRADETGYVAGQWGVRTTIAAGGATVTGGLGLLGKSNADIGARPTIDFGVLANTFFVAAPTGYTVSPIVPFVIRTTSFSDGGVTRPAGLYVDAAFITNLTAVYATIQNLVAGNVATLSLSAAQLTAGDGTIGGNLKSSNFVSGFSGWIATPGGYFEANNVVIRNAVYTGTIFAGAGTIGGFTISSADLRSNNYVPGTSGLRMNAADGSMEVYNLYARGNIEATSLNAATGTFNGTLNVRSATSGARMEIINSVIKVFDAAGVVRVKIGDLT